MHGQLKFLSGLLEIRAFLQERLRQIGCAIGKLLQNLNPFFPSQLRLLLGEAQPHKLHLALFVGFQLGLMCIVVLLHIFIIDRDAVLKISGPKSDHAHVKLVVSPPKIFIELPFRNCDACRQ